MAKKKDLDYYRAKGLRQFQAEFIIKFLESEDKTYWQFVSPVGSGKTRIAATIANELLANSAKHILVLAPSSLLYQWQSEFLNTAGAYKNLIVDRKTYLEMESKVPVGANPWPTSESVLMSIDLAKRDDMIENINAVSWDLIIIDECHLLKGRKRKAMFNQLISSGTIRRCLLLTCLESSISPEVETIRVSISEIVDWNKEPIYDLAKPKVSQILYDRTKEELSFLNQLHGFVGQLSDQWLDGDPESHIILQAGLSSIYNAEKILFRLKDALEKIRHKSVHGLPLTDEDIKMIQKQLGTFADESRYIQNGDEIKTMQSQNFITLYSKLELLLSQIEEMSVDSKLDALINHLQSYFEFEVEGTPYLCVYTSFLNTAQYINSSLRAQGWGVSIYSLTSALLPDERMRRIQEFRKSGGIIIVTDSALKGVTIDYVDYCINYDLPLNPMIFYIRSTRFLRAKNEFRMAVLKDRSEVLAWEKFLEGSYTSDC